MPPTRTFHVHQSILDGEIRLTKDVTSDPTAHKSAKHLGHRSQLAVPLMREGMAIGSITLGHPHAEGFTEAYVELLKTFAEQAVIAIGSVGTFRELQTRTADLQESLEYQTAISDVLKVINRSTFDLDQVFQAVVTTAVRLCRADQATIYRHQDGEYCWAAGYGLAPAYERIERESRIIPGMGTLVGRVALEGRMVQIIDAWTDPLYEVKEDARVGGVHTMLGVPLLRDGVPIGVIGLARRRVEPYTDRQIALVSTFADQAVIAVENTRLLTEQQEALEQQTATAEVLQVINASPGNLTPVFDSMLEKAMHLCGAAFGELYTLDGDDFRPVALMGIPAALAAYRRSAPPPAPAGSIVQRIRDGANIVHTADAKDADLYRSGEPTRRALVDLGGARTVLTVALRKDEALLGFISIYRQEVRLFTDRQIALLENFAAQAVIAMENARLIDEQREALEQQTATAEVLQVINASPGNLAPVFNAMLEKATRLCDAAFGDLLIYNSETFHRAAMQGVTPAMAEFLREPIHAESEPGSALYRMVHGENILHQADITDDEVYRSGLRSRRILADLMGARTRLMVALRKDDILLGVFNIFRQEVRPFSDKQIALLENFAAQAVIAMENARLINEQNEALEQQTATAEVLQVINANPGNLAPVFDAILEKAHNLCDVTVGSLSIYLNGFVHTAATRGFSEEYQALLRHPYPAIGSHQTLMRGGPSRQTSDFRTVPVRPEMASSLDHFERMNLRTGLWVPLRKDGTALGCISSYRDKVQPFSEKEIALLENFAAQGVIAMENARLLNEIRQRQEELRVTFENMGDGVAMFDETQHLVAWNRKFQEVLDVPDDIIARRQTFSEYVHYLAERGEYDPEADPEEHVRRLIEQAGQSRTYERTRPDGRVIEIRHNPVPGGGFVLIYADITERKRNEEEIRAARDAAETALRELRTAQANLIQAEKMASLGQLTAGIAHEIKNPLNFVNNFSALSVELINELWEVLAPEPLANTVRTEVEDLTGLLKGNLEKVVQHGQRADGIVKAMLEHSRGSSAERRMVDLNELIDEALNLAYHGARAQDQSFNVTLERDFGAGIAPIEVNPQDMTRVFLNLFSNGFYAATRRVQTGAESGFVPTLKVTTIDAGDAVEIRVWDNGTGIPAEIRDKLFQPFFTTKPTGEGTGLGLSITYDIVTKAHAGSIAVDSKVGEYSKFTIRLPRNP